ncbi:MAG: nodulation protein NfeD, partial [Melioribacteraceae bacterium]|nr:nodulation protein NfeD [Melioribacteraceae bacterium]
ADYINYGIEEAISQNSECLIIKLNTPGGLLKSTRIIVSQFLESKIPIVVYVSPGGSQAASAGVFITMAAHVAVMAPGTNIGAAHPVTLQGKQDSVMMKKVTNDAAAFIRTISEKRKRNNQWAEDAVRQSLSITESEALKENVIDLIATNVDELSEKLHGIEVETTEGVKSLNTEDAEIIYLEKTFQQKLFGIISDPNIAYVLLMLGFYGLLFELYNPGAILPGVVGGICLILAFYSFHTLPINYAGLALIIFAIILFILEIKIVSYGILTIGGTVSLVLGSIMLIDVESALESISISWEVILAVVVLTLAFFIFAIGFGIKAQKKKVTTGSKGIINEKGKAISQLEPTGQVKVHGEIWSAECEEGVIKKGENIVVTDIIELTLIVKRID